MSTSRKCRARGGVQHCANPNCPEKQGRTLDLVAFRARRQANPAPAKTEAAVVTDLSARLQERHLDASVAELGFDSIEDFRADMTATILAEETQRMRDKFTEQLELQYDGLRARYNHALRTGGNALGARLTLGGLKYARELVEAAVNKENVDGLEIDKLLGKLRREKKSSPNAEWALGIENVAVALKRVYGDKIAWDRARQQRRADGV